MYPPIVLPGLAVVVADDPEAIRDFCKYYSQGNEKWIYENLKR